MKKFKWTKGWDPNNSVCWVDLDELGSFRLMVIKETESDIVAEAVNGEWFWEVEDDTVYGGENSFGYCTSKKAAQRAAEEEFIRFLKKTKKELDATIKAYSKKGK